MNVCEAGVGVAVAGGVGGADLEGVRAVGERPGRVAGSAGRERLAVDAALEASTPGSPRANSNVGVGVAGRAGRRRVDARVCGGGGVDGEGARRGRRVDVAGGVGGAHLEGVLRRRPACRGERRRARGEGAAVDAALEGRRSRWH